MISTRPLATLLASTAMLISLAAAAPAWAERAARTEFVAAGTPVPIHLLSPLSSATAQAGDRFAFAAEREVAVDGRVVVVDGAQGEGEVVEAVKARGSGRSGSLRLRFLWIYAADGGKLRLSRAVDARSEEDRRGAASTATIVGFATFGLGGLFGHNFAHGRDMTIDERRVLTTCVSASAHVAATRSATTADAGFDR